MATQAITAVWGMRPVAEAPEDRNAKMYAAQRNARRGPTPEISFVKHLDNTRLQAVADPQRIREMRNFVAAMIVLFALVMVYGWQHYNSIEAGYRIESQKQVLDQLAENNRRLHLQEAQLSSPTRLDQYARALGMDAPTPLQLVRQNPGAGSAPVEARVVTPQLPQ